MPVKTETIWGSCGEGSQALLRSTADAGYQSASTGRLRNGQRLKSVQIILSNLADSRRLNEVFLGTF
jgi:hypothetical protein